MTYASRTPSRALPPLPAGAVKRYARWRNALLALALGFTATPSLADDDCDVPIQQWQSREAVRQMATSRGWEVQRLKIDDGCYEIRGVDAQGRTFKAKIDPQTLAIVKIKYRNRDRHHEHRHKHEPVASEPAAPHGDRVGTPPRNPVDQ